MARVLLLEDEPALHRLYRRALERSGFEVTSAYTLAEARQALQQHTFDFFLVDLRLPDGNAVHLLTEFKDHLKAQGTEVIVLTAEARQRDEVTQLGFEYYFEKPISLQMLLQFLERLKAQRAEQT